MIGILFVVLSVMFLVVLATAVLLLLDKNAEIEQLTRNGAAQAKQITDLASECDRLTADLKVAETSEVLATLTERMGGGTWPTP